MKHFGYYFKDNLCIRYGCLIHHCEDHIGKTNGEDIEEIMSNIICHMRKND